MSVFGKNERVLVVERTEGFAVEAMLRKTARRIHIEVDTFQAAQVR